MRNYLITGGSGFLAEGILTELRRYLGNNIFLMARNEGNLIKIKNKFSSEDITIIPGDIYDEYDCRKAFEISKPEIVLHLAAFKHVTMAEGFVYDCVTSNIHGTLNLLKQASFFSPKYFVFISTDKAAQVNGVYGASKLLGECLTADYAKTFQEIRYRIIRYGNVFGSTGSFIYKWIERVKSGQQITITDPGATRFFFSVQDAVELIFSALDDKAPLLTIPKMKAVSMGTVLEAFKTMWPPELFKEKVTGLNPGENMHETLDGKVFSNQVEQFSKEEFTEKFLMPMRKEFSL